MSKQIVILEFDGLEYNLVERFKLLSLKQKYYGKVQIPPECYEKNGKRVSHYQYESTSGKNMEGNRKLFAAIYQDVKKMAKTSVVMLICERANVILTIHIS